jgi:hypothetical protein
MDYGYLLVGKQSNESGQKSSIARKAVSRYNSRCFFAGENNLENHSGRMTVGPVNALLERGNL